MPGTRLIVAILTYRRPAQLRDAVASVRPQVDAAPAGVEATILVVDNDPEGSAEGSVAAMPGVTYVHERRPGIAAARNRALAEAGDARLLVFLDDDERAEPGWLASLVAVWRATGADAVQGRLVTHLPDDADPYLRAGGFFDRAIVATGTSLPAAATYNLLLDLDTLRAHDLRFDETLGLAGGEDSLLTSTLVRRGGRIVACAEAVAVDRLAPERASRRWVRRRAFGQGTVLQSTRQRLARSRRESALRRLEGVAGGLARIAAGSAAAIAGLLTGSLARRARGERMALRGGGVIARAIGYRHRTYARPAARTP